MTAVRPTPVDETPAARLRAGFLAWQCRLRQHAMRAHGGRPGPGMRPRVARPDGTELAPAVTVVLIEAEPSDSIAQFRHIARKTHDPERRYREALALLSSTYFQRPERFADLLTALFAVDSHRAERLVAEGRCVLDFEQFSQRFRIPCRVSALAPAAPAFQATYWHNHLFNPAMPAAVRILGFAPDWREATAEPPL